MKCYYVTPTGTTNDQDTMVSPIKLHKHKYFTSYLSSYECFPNKVCHNPTVLRKCDPYCVVFCTHLKFFLALMLIYKLDRRTIF